MKQFAMTSRPSRNLGIGTSSREMRARLLLFLAAAASFVLSVSLWFAGNELQGIFVGLWVPSILALGAIVLPRSVGSCATSACSLWVSLSRCSSWLRSRSSSGGRFWTGAARPSTGQRQKTHRGERGQTRHLQAIDAPLTVVAVIESRRLERFAACCTRLGSDLRAPRRSRLEGRSHVRG